MKSGCFRLFRFIHILVRLKRLRFDKSDTIYRYFYQHDKLIDNQLAYWRYTVSTRKKIEHFSLVMSCPYFAFASGIRNSGLWNPENPQLKESGIPLKIEIWNLSSSDRESAGESSAWNPESKTRSLGFPYPKLYVVDNAWGDWTMYIETNSTLFAS